MSDFSIELSVIFLLMRRTRYSTYLSISKRQASLFYLLSEATFLAGKAIRIAYTIELNKSRD